MPFINRDSWSIYYEVIGTSGPWLTLINGHTRSSRDFRLLAGHFSKQGLRCLIFDNRGAGETQGEGPFTLHDIAEDVAQLWHQHGIDQSIVMGLSMGGLISQILAHEYPQKVLGLILVSTGSSEQSLGVEAHTSWGSSTESIERKLQAYFTPNFMSRNKLLVQAMAKQILKAIQSEDFELKAQSQRDAMQGVNTRPYLSHIRCPSLILHGTEDQIIPYSEGEDLAKLIPKAELKRLEGIGHLVLAEYSKQLSEDTLEFIRRYGWINP